MATANPDRKKYAVGDEAQEKISEGVKKGADIVASTLGPAGRNVLIERKNRTPIVVDDGITAINNLILEDELENLGANSLVDAATKASDFAGDGTSTTIVLTRAIYESGKKLLGLMGFGKTPFEIKEELETAKKEVIEKLQAKSKPIKTKEEIKSVALAAYNDEPMAEVVADMIEKVGENGVVIVEEGWGRETEVDFQTGFKFAGKLAHQLFSNTPEEGLNLEGLPILITDMDFVNLNDLIPLFKDLSQSQEQGVIVIAHNYEKLAIEQTIRTNIFNAQNRSPFRIWLVRTPSFTSRKYEDFAIFTGGRFFSKEKSDKILEAKVEELGRANTFKLTKLGVGDGIVIGGAGKKEDVNTRLLELKLLWEDEKVKLVKNALSQDIAALASAIGIIKVASPSEAETEHIRLKTKNAVKSCQAAVAEGAVRGAGLALKEISDELPEGHILKEALKSPYETIQRNAGGKLKIPENLNDATKVIRTALEQACSQALMLINTGTIIAFRNEGDRKDAAEIIAKTKENKKDD